MSLHVFGIRHHGPGCARALELALAAVSPDVVLIEGPPDAQEALASVAAEGMTPPVALLVHSVEQPRDSVFYPFAEFSPEWRALRFAAERGVPARFMDLPCANAMAMRKAEAEAEAKEEAEGEEGDEDVEDAESGSGSGEEALIDDPVGVLAEAAGFKDHEQWWDVQVEQRRDGAGLFESILEAMKVLREGEGDGSSRRRHRRHEVQREAYMRTVIRSAQKEGFQRIAVVCGAWHAPVLAEMGPAKRDAEALRGLPKMKVAATWIPWTHSRLSYRSGYGAGVDSPGWYAHVFRHGERAPVVWATLAARLLREQDLDASAANVIETVRLAGALASMRDLPAPGLGELREAIEAVLCGGQPALLSLLRARLEIGESLGSVPEQVGQVPLQRDFEREVKRLRWKLSAEQVVVELDLRKELDRDRSRLVHRLLVLGVRWGESTAATARTLGTFREAWRLCWRPELAVELIAGNLHGNTVEAAATAALREQAAQAGLADLTRLVEVATVAALPDALDALVGELDARAAGTSDVRAQMEALEPLVRVVRYGDVRESRAERLAPVVRALFQRVVVGLQPACTQLDDEAAAVMVAALDRAHASCLLLDDAALRSDWLEALGRLPEGGGVHPRLAGRACRLLLEQKVIDEEQLARRAGLALSAGVEPSHASQWIEGLVAGEGLLLVHQEVLLGVLDRWLAALGDEPFQAQLPLLRRAFSGLTAPERRELGRKIKQSQVAGPRRGARGPESEPLDERRAALVLPVLAHVLGVAPDAGVARE